MILQQIISSPIEEQLFKQTYRILTEEYNLVPPKSGRSTNHFRILIWEDPKEQIGRYRVYCAHNEIENNTLVDIINFQYWNDHRLDHNTFTDNPMKNILNRITSLTTNYTILAKIELETYPELEQKRIVSIHPKSPPETFIYNL